MKKLMIFFLLTISMMGNTSFALAKISTDPIDSEKIFEESVQKVQEKIPEILLFREEAIELYFEIIKKFREKKPLARSYSKRIYEISRKRKEIRQFLSKLIKKYRYSINDYSKGDYAHEGKVWAFKRAYLVTSLLFIMDDNFLTETSLYQMDGKLRRFVNERNKSFGLKKRDGLQRSAKIFYSYRTMADRAKGLKIVKLAQKMEALDKNNSKTQKLLKLFLNSSFSFKKRYKMSYGKKLVSNFKANLKKHFTGKFGLWDMIVNLKDNLVFGVSYAFGNSIAQIQWRQGSLAHNKKALESLSKVLQPGDVIWNKTRSKVSGVIISSIGFWNHNALYIGTEKQLKELGIWDHPLLVPHQKAIRKGHYVIEALGMGVVLSPMDHVMNVDDLAVGRRRGSDRDKQRDVILSALEQFGKKYDFNMDTNSAETIICSELVYIVYDQVDWEQTTLLGHWSITPDLTAKQTINNGAFQILSMYYQGKKVEKGLEDHMRNLLTDRKTNL